MPGELGSGLFWVDDTAYPVGKFFIYRAEETILVNSNEMGSVAFFGHYSEFEDANDNAFASIEDLVNYVNKMIFLDEGDASVDPYIFEVSEGSSLRYDRRRVYGSHTVPLTGDISEDLIMDYHPHNGEGFIFHKSSTEPDMPEGFVKEGGAYVSGQLNIIKYQFVSNGFKLYSVLTIRDFDSPDVYDGLVIHYDFNQDPEERSFIIDKSGNGNHGKIINPEDIEWISELASFKIKVGNNEEEEKRGYIKIPFRKSMGFVKENLTVLIEFGKDSLSAGTFFGTYSLGSGNDGFRLATVSDGRMEMGLNPETTGTSGRGRSRSPNGLYPTNGNTLRCVMTYDGEILRFYVNGALNSTNDVPNGLNVFNEEEWTLGKINGDTVKSKCTFGRLAVWNRVLSLEEIDAIDKGSIDGEVIKVEKYCPFQDIITSEGMDAEGATDSWVQRQCYSDPDDILVSNEYTRSGTTSGRFYLRKGLRYQLEKHRTELLSFSGMETEMSKMKKWMAFSVYFPSDYYIDPSHDIAEVIHQLHVGFSQSPPISIRTQVDGFYAQICYGEFDPKVEEEADLKATLRKILRFGKIRKGEWHDFIIYYEIDPTNGICKIWLNRELMVDYKGPTMYSNKVDWTFSWKVGLYCSQWGAGSLETIPDERLLFYDEVRIASNVAPSYIMFSKMDPEGRKALSGVNYPDHHLENVFET